MQLNGTAEQCTVSSTAIKETEQLVDSLQTENALLTKRLAEVEGMHEFVSEPLLMKLRTTRRYERVKRNSNNQGIVVTVTADD